ncbi:MAG: hypothetical protein WDZ66_03930 [Steroidobacteraceae bacterium]
MSPRAIRERPGPTTFDDWRRQPNRSAEIWRAAHTERAVAARRRAVAINSAEKAKRERLMAELHESLRAPLVPPSGAKSGGSEL